MIIFLDTVFSHDIVKYRFYAVKPNKKRGKEMKKLLAILLLLCCVGGLLFADDYSNCLLLIDKKLDTATVKAIQNYSANLTESQKYFLYENNKSNAMIPAAVNLLLGAGIGSYIQGDKVGGTISLLADLAGYGMYLIGYVNTAIADDSTQVEKNVAMAVSGLLVILANKVYSCVRPFSYAESYNKRLSNALYGGPVVALVPSIDRNGQTGLSLSARIDL